MEIIIFKEVLKENLTQVKYTASCVTTFVEALCPKIKASDIQIDWFKKQKQSSTDIVFQIQGSPITISPFAVNRTLENILFIDKLSIEYMKVIPAFASQDANIIDIAKEILEEYPEATVFTADMDKTNESVGHTKSFVRAPNPKSSAIRVPVSEFFRLMDRPTMQLEDYTKTKALLTSENAENIKLGITSCLRWNAVTSFEYLIMLGHINKEILKGDVLLNYLKTISASTSQNGFQGELHLDTIDTLCELNSAVRDGDPSIYKQDKTRMMSFILAEYNPLITEKSDKFMFKAKLKFK
jgi:hypothetical protein